MAKQFIRHLEFYGFPDQNGYSSDINPVDLSDIIEKNKEQDKEIADLEGEKADKKDLVELSGTVDTLISAQTNFNNTVVETLSGISADIDTLKDVDNEFATQLSALTEGVNSLNEELEDFSGETSDAISALTEDVAELSEKSDTYALKEDTYTKQEVDNLISGGVSVYATEEWVLAQDYLTAESGDTMYTKIEDFNALSSDIESAMTDVNDSISGINDSIDEINTSIEGINEDINELNEDFSAFTEDINNSISGINDSINDITEQVSSITDSIDDISDIISGNTRDINGLTNDVEEISGKTDQNTSDISEINSKLETKANRTDVENLHSEMVNGLEALENAKAEKTDLNFVSGAAVSVDAKVDAEIARSTSADTAMQGKVNELNSTVEDTVETVGAFNNRISSLESGLANEITNREAADNALIGNSSDNMNANTIYGAKSFASEMKRQAISSAKTYTDDKVSAFSTELANIEADFDRKLTSAATTSYVDSRINETKVSLRSEMVSGDTEERNRAMMAENNILGEIADFNDKIRDVKTDVANNETRINAITAWNGSDPSRYDDSGNGVLDVLHRELHNLIETLTQKGILP